MAVGSRHSCALSYSGAIKCWGDNTSGQLGNNTVATSSVPVFVSGISNATSIATGGLHTCAIDANGNVKCWGSNSSGQIGDGSYVDRGAPITISSLGADNAEISAGKTHTCVRKNDGRVFCWGSNSYGQLGQSDLQNRNTPTLVNGLTGITRISAGGQHTCVISNSGGVKCWGLNYDGQLGAGNAWSQTPVTVLNFLGATPTPTPTITQTPTPTLTTSSTPTHTSTPIPNYATYLPMILRAPSSCDLFEPNSNRYLLRYGPVYSEVDYSRPLCQYDPEDNFYFEASGPQTAHVSLSLPQNLAGHVTLSLYGPDQGSGSMEQPICSSVATLSTYALNCPITEAGRFVIRIQSMDSNTYFNNSSFYTLNASFR